MATSCTAPPAPAALLILTAVAPTATIISARKSPVHPLLAPPIAACPTILSTITRLATISNGSEGALSESISTRTATTAPEIADLVTYSESQIEVTWWASSAFETDYYFIYAYSGDASCDPHAEVCPGEKLVFGSLRWSAPSTFNCYQWTDPRHAL